MFRSMLLVTSFSTALLLAFRPSDGAEPTADDYVTFVKPLDGTWTLFSGEDGKTPIGSWSFRLAPNKKCYLNRGWSEGGPAWQSLDGYDPAAKAWTMVSFAADGSFSRNALEVADLKPGKVMRPGLVGVWRQKQFGPDGKVVSSVSNHHCKKAAEKELVLAWTDRKEDGKTLPDVTVKSVRAETPSKPTAAGPARSPAAAGPTSEDYVQFWKPILGPWKWTGESDGKETSGSIRFELAENKSCLLTRYEGQGLPSTQRIDGYDPATKKWTMAGFSTQGVFYYATLDIRGMKKGKTFAEGPIGRWEYKQSNPDGTTTSGSADFSCTRWGKDRYAVLWSDRVENGKRIADLKWFQERPK